MKFKILPLGYTQTDKFIWSRYKLISLEHSLIKISHDSKVIKCDSQGPMISKELFMVLDIIITYTKLLKNHYIPSDVLQMSSGSINMSISNLYNQTAKKKYEFEKNSIKQRRDQN